MAKTKKKTGREDGPEELPSLRFRAAVVSNKTATGTWSWIEIPERVTRALAPWQKSGHVRIDATLNDTEVQGSLMPRGGGRQMLVLNAAVRRDAGIKSGDTVRVTVSPRTNDAVRVPEDLAKAIGAKGRRTFEAMDSTRRWHLVRYVTGANTGTTRAKHIDRVVDHVLGRAPKTETSVKRGPTGWYCPACGKRFSRVDAEHPCEPIALEVPFARKPALVRELYDAVAKYVLAQGHVTRAVAKDSVGFVGGRRFMHAVPRKAWLELRLFLTRRVELTRVKVYTVEPTLHVNGVQLRSHTDLDDEVKSLLREAYAYGLPGGAERAPTAPRAQTSGAGWDREVDDSFFEGLSEE